MKYIFKNKCGITGIYLLRYLAFLQMQVICVILQPSLILQAVGLVKLKNTDVSVLSCSADNVAAHTD